MKPEFVYLLAEGAFYTEPATVKIGFTTDPLGRWRSLRTSLPECSFLHMWFTVEFPGRDLEKELHYYYRDTRKGGEFFWLPSSEILWLGDAPPSFFNPGNLDSPWWFLRERPWQEREQALREWPSFHQETMAQPAISQVIKPKHPQIFRERSAPNFTN